MELNQLFLSMEYRYSKITLSSHKIHIFDHVNDRLLCGVNRWKYPPFKIYKKRLNAKDMFDDHLSITERRGGPNPYKFVCVKCNNIIKDICNKGGIKMTEEEFRKIEILKGSKWQEVKFDKLELNNIVRMFEPYGSTVCMKEDCSTMWKVIKAPYKGVNDVLTIDIESLKRPLKYKI